MLKSKNTESKKTVAVIGAGVVGICTALELLREGYRVTLFDKNEPASQVSSGNGGFLATQFCEPLATPNNIQQALYSPFDPNTAFKVTVDHWPFFPVTALLFIKNTAHARVEHNRKAMLKLNEYAVASWKIILEFANSASHLRTTGYLKVWENKEDIIKTIATQKKMQKLGFNSRLIRDEDLFEVEPTLSAHISHGLFFENAHHLSDPHLVCTELYEHFIAMGGEFKFREVLEVQPSVDDHRTKVIIKNGIYRYDKAVICAGVWSKQLLKCLDIEIPLTVERGYHLTHPSSSQQPTHIIESVDRHVLISPLDSGLRIVGFGEYANLNSPQSKFRHSRLSKHINALLKATLPIKTAKRWMGMRPTFPDSIPVIDLHPQHPQIGLVFGHQHLGMTQSAISARLIVGLLDDNANQNIMQSFKEIMSAYKVTRFAKDEVKLPKFITRLKQ